MKKIIRQIVIATVHLSIFSLFYNIYYKIAVEVSIHLMKKIPAVSSIFVRRSFSVPGWIAGYSDIDLAIVIKTLPPVDEVLILQRMYNTLKVLRFFFPVVSDRIFFVNETDLTRWLSYGNIRRLEFSSWIKRYG
jgi:hypothetical protein